MSRPRMGRWAKRTIHSEGFNGLTTRIMQEKEWKRDEKTIDKLKQVWSVYTKCPRAEARKKIMEAYNCTYRHANRLIEQAEEFFVDSLDKEAERIKLIHRYEAQIYNENNPPELVLAYEKLLLAVMGMTKEDKGKEKARPLPMMHYSTDPRSLSEELPPEEDSDEEDE